MALREAGIRLTLQGAAEYKAGLKSVSQELRTMATESKLALAQLGNNASITDTYNTRMKSLGNEIKLTNDKTRMFSDRQRDLTKSQDEITKSIDKTTASYKSSQAETKKLKDEYDKLVESQGKNSKEAKEAYTAWKESEKATKALKTELNQLEVAYNQNSKELAKMPNELAKAELATQRLRNEAQKLHEEYRNQGGRLADTAKAWQDFGSNLVTAGGHMTKVGDWATQRFTVPIVTGLGLAVGQAKTFQSEMGAMLPLIAEGGNITAEHRAQVEQLGNASRTMAIEYGQYTSDLNSGMAELIRNGYNSSQVLGMMPNVLDASIASGEEFGVVMSTTANVLSQFQLKGESTNETLANTQRVVDSLTYVANATSSGFYDLGQGMAYVGPVANTLNMSVEETASILGILSDNGIEASQGGTALRGALTRLLKPSKQNAEAMAELGISVDDYKNGLIDFPTILDTIAENTKNLTDEQKAALIAQAFGTESQSAMNALVSAGGDALRDMTDAARGATGATKEIADAIKETPQFKFDQSLAQLRDVGIELGSKLLPHVTNAVSAFGDWVHAFNELDDSTQNFIIKAGLVTAAVGPIIGTLGRLTTATGNTVTGIGKMIQWFGKITTPKNVTDMTGDFIAFGGATTTATTKVGLFSSALGFISSPAGMATVAIAGITAAYLLLTEESRNAHSAIQEFPNIDGVTHEQAESIRSTYDAYSELGIALETLAGQTVTYADTVKGAVSDIVDEIARINKDNIEGLSELYKDLPPQVMAMYDDLMLEEERLGEHRVNRAKQVQDSITEIMENASKEQRQLTVAEQQFIIQARNELAALQAESLGATAEQSRQIYETLTADLANMNREQLIVHEQNIRTALQNMDYGFQQQKQQILDTIGETHPEVAQAMITELEAVYDISRQKMMSEWAKTLATQGEMAELSGQELYQAIANYMNSIIPGLNILPEEVRAMMEDTSTAMQEGVENMVQPLEGADARVQEAAQKFNSAIMQFANSIEEGLSPENLNAQQLEDFMQQITDLGVTWNDLKFMRHSPYIDDNTKEFIDNIVEAHGGWEAIELAEKNAQVNVMGMDELEQLINLFGVDFGSLSDEQKEALVNANGAKELSDLLVQYGIWVATDPAEAKQAVVETDDALMKFQPLLESLDLWNSTEFLSKYADIDTNAPDAQEQIANLIAQWTGIPVEEVKSMMTETNAEESAGEIQAYRGEVDATPVHTESTFTAGVGATSENTGVVAGWRGELESTPTEKSSSIQSNIFSTIANTVALLAYNLAVGAMTDKSVSANTATPGLPKDTNLVNDWNKSMRDMFNKTSTATTRTPNLPSNTNLVNNWTSAMRNTFNKTSTLTTRTPNISGNTSSVWSWISALNSAYSTSSTFTTYRRTVYQTVGRAFAEGGHIDMFAEGGNLKWGGMFASGGMVPKGFMGIVGEAGPELFHVTESGVSITPLAPGEKMEGVEGAFAKFAEKNGLTGSGSGTVVNVTFNNPVVREDSDIDKLVEKVERVITRNMKRDKVMRKGSAVGFG